MMQDEVNRVVIGKDENAVRQLISMISSENHHVVSWHLYHTIYVSDSHLVLVPSSCTFSHPG